MSDSKRKYWRQRNLLSEQLEPRQLLAITPAWMENCPTPTVNETAPLDVTEDGFVTSLDALQVLNRLNQSKGCSEPSQQADQKQLHLDVNRDGTVTSLDALTILNQIQAASVGAVAAEAANAEPAAAEAAPVDVIQFARDLSTAGAVVYTAPAESVSQSQLERFGAARTLLNQVVGVDDNGIRTPAASDIEVIVFPTWVFADGSRLIGDQPLEQLASAADLTLPTLDPSSLLQPIAPASMLSGSPIHLPLNGFNETDSPITFTVSSDTAEVVPEIITGRSLRFDVDQFGEMVFQLFDDEAPRVTERITTLAEQDFYDGVIFHRVIDGFVIQGGDPEGTGRGGSDLPDFDDQYDFDLQHNQTGVLSMAKSADDTNNSQFFITEGAQRHLDFQHSIFGHLVVGESVRDAISDTDVDRQARPITTVVMNSVEVFDDMENGLLRISAPEGFEGSATVTVVANLGDESVTRTFEVTAVPDTFNGGPFLGELDGDTTINKNEVFELTLVGFDVEGDALEYGASIQNNADATLVLDETTGLLQITPPADFVGDLNVRVWVSPVEPSNTTDRLDVQSFVVSFVEPGSQALLTTKLESDSGRRDDDLVTSKSVTLLVDGAVPGVLLEMVVDGQVVEVIDPVDAQVRFSEQQLAEGDYEVFVRHVTANGDVVSSSTPVLVTIDQTNPEPVVVTLPPSPVAGAELVFDLDNSDVDVEVTIVAAPEGVRLDSQQRIVWTPTNGQVGLQLFSLQLEDLAGNITTQQVEVDVAVRPIVAEEIDLHDFVTRLSEEGATLYGARWDVGTYQQRQLFDDAKTALSFVEVTAPDRSLNAIGVEQQIEVLPTWVFADGTRLEGVQSLDALAGMLTFDTLPAPGLTLAPFAAVELHAGSPLHLAIDGDASPDVSISYSVASDSALVDATVASSNRVLRLQVTGYGDMLFELFDGRVPEATQHLVELVDAGVFNGVDWGAINGSGLAFGDAANEGLGTDDVRQLDDQFHPDLQHNSAGLLSFAKLVDDGNHQHLEVSNGARRGLDFHQTIVGKLVDGEEVRVALQDALTDVGGRTRFDLQIASAEILDNAENRLLTLTAVEGASGSAVVTVTATSSSGDSVQQSFDVNVSADPYNSGPYLDVDNFSQVVAGDAVRVNLAAIDVEGDDVRYFARPVSGAAVDFEFDPVTGQLDLSGVNLDAPAEFLVGVYPAGGIVDQIDRYDRQRLTVPQAVRGDLTRDGVVGAADLEQLCAAIKDSASDSEFDLNSDLKLDADDLDVMVRELLGIVHGDVNFDGVFDGDDFVQVFMVGEYQDAEAGNSTWSTGDWNCDGDFDTRDLVAVSSAG